MSGTCRSRAGAPSGGRRAVALLWLSAALFVARPAHADLELRPARLYWDRNDILRAAFTYRDAIDEPMIAKKLSNGLAVTVVMRGYVYPEGGGDPIALTAHTCRVAYDLWNEVFRVAVNGIARAPVVNLKGVYRLCTDMVDLPIADRSTFRAAPNGFFLAVKVEVNPVSDDVAQKIQSWVTRPSGAAGLIGPGDALFASFVGVFMRRVATADRVVEFRTALFPP